MLRLAVLVGLFAALLGPLAAHGQNATWLGTSGEFGTAANWSPPTVPTGIATFGASNTTTITIDFLAYTGNTGGATVSTLQFNLGAPAYSFYVYINTNLTGTGIINNSSNSPTFIIAGAGNLHFENSSTAGNAIINNAAAPLGSPGYTAFENTSTAGNATITTNNGGFTYFEDSSTAGNAVITTNNGGSTVFVNAAAGGEAQFITNAGGKFDISELFGSSGMTAGSIEGAGTYYLGSKKLTVGGNDLSTTVSGIIENGGMSGGTGGSLIKVGTGTLTLSGANTYTGGTSLNSGSLVVGNNSALGTGTLSMAAGTTLSFVAGSNFTISNAIQVTGDPSFAPPSGTVQTIPGVISDGTSPGTVEMVGAGTLVLPA
jgi:autotransporter-associated beta strand protein